MTVKDIMDKLGQQHYKLRTPEDNLIKHYRGNETIEEVYQSRFVEDWFIDDGVVVITI